MTDGYVHRSSFIIGLALGAVIAYVFYGKNAEALVAENMNLQVKLGTKHVNLESCIGARKRLVKQNLALENQLLIEKRKSKKQKKGK